MNKKKLIVVVFFITFLIYLYYQSTNIKQKNVIRQKTYTCSNLKYRSFGDQLFQIANIVSLASKTNQLVIFPNINFILFDDRITKLFTEEIPQDAIDINTAVTLDVLLVRHYFTFNYSLVLFILNQIPALLSSQCIGLHFEYSKNLKQKYYIDSIQYLREEFPNSLVIVFTTDQESQKEVHNMDFFLNCKNTVLSPLQTIEENFIAFNVCNFKILSFQSSFSWWAGWLDTRYNSKIISPSSLTKNPQNWIMYNETNFIPKKNLEKFGGIMKYKNQQHFLQISEAFRRIYPHSKLKVIVESGDQIIQKDIEFFKADLIYAYKDLKEFIHCMEDFIEPYVIFIVGENQLKYPIDKEKEARKAHKYGYGSRIFDTSLVQQLKLTPENSKDKKLTEDWCLSLLSMFR